MANPNGRPTKLQPHLIETICKHLRLGHTQATACRLARVSESTYYEWLGRGDQEPNSLFAEFSEAVKEAMAQAEDDALQTIRDAARPWTRTVVSERPGENGQKLLFTEVVEERGQWQAAAWFLERTRPAQYGRRQVVHHEGDLHIKRIRFDDEPEAKTAGAIP